MTVGGVRSGPFVLGLTGSIGMGKSTVAAMFAERGVPVFDADAEVHRLQAPESPLLDEIEAEFPGVTGAEGLDRAALGAIVFGDPDVLARLEALIHPKIARLRAEFLARHTEQDLVVMDIPLLFENGRIDMLDAVVVVSAPANVQRERVMARADMTERKFSEILARQMPDAEKRKRADFVIETGCPIGETEVAVDALIACLT